MTPRPGPALAASVLLAWIPLLAPEPACAASPEPVGAAHGMVVAAQRLAAEAGVTVLREGGNAVDAAVATSYALAVTFPEAGNLGGGGFMTFRLSDGKTRFLDFREKAPGRATPTMFLDEAGHPVPERSTRGWLSVAVPGSVAGLETARAIWGRLGRAADLAPAIRLARDGFVLTQGDVAGFDLVAGEISASPAIRALFSGPGGAPLRPGDRLRQPALARTLQLIARDGPDAFYRGPIARAIVRASAAGGGILTADDLARYRTRVLAPVSCTYRGFLVESAPPPSAGGLVLCETLDVLGGWSLGPLGFHSAVGVHDLADAMRFAFRDREAVVGDPAFVHVPVASLLSAAHADAIRRAIPSDHASPPAAPPPAAGSEGRNTTQVSVVDADGNAVSLTTTLNDFFGAFVVAGDTGIVMNDEMDDFDTAPGRPNLYGLVQGTENEVEPGRTPVSSMSPTVVSRGGHLVMVIGSPGGARIPTITLEAILNVIDHGMDIASAIDAPRIHDQDIPDVIEAEPGALSPDTVALLQRMGYAVKPHRNWGEAMGILVGGPALGRPGTGGFRLYGAADVRAPAGAAVGY